MPDLEQNLTSLREVAYRDDGQAVAVPASGKAGDWPLADRLAGALR